MFCLSQTMEVAQKFLCTFHFNMYFTYIAYFQTLKVVINQSCDNFGHSYSHLTLWDNKQQHYNSPCFMDLVCSRFDFYVVSTFVNIQASPRRKDVATEITWNTYSFQMFRLNVISYWSLDSFLTTNFANRWGVLYGCPICFFATNDHILAFLHHWLNFLIKCLEVVTWLIWNCFWGRGWAWTLFVAF